MERLSHSCTLGAAARPGDRLSSREPEGVTTELRSTGLDVGESGYRVPAGTPLIQLLRDCATAGSYFVE